MAPVEVSNWDGKGQEVEKPITYYPITRLEEVKRRNFSNEMWLVIHWFPVSFLHVRNQTLLKRPCGDLGSLSPWE
ncbi:Cytochrome b5 type B [Galemys pyrenaicus]|uniref:Cytochrome b5 type B n=1 Tax=Galemys pyrenaicus TaxID=202257 RepID=A0A8J6DGY8_GALPY|nr:Cytochrome b5 type B [Galemys pyrenaicus]